MTSRNRPLSLRVPAELIDVAEFFSKEQHIDRPAVFRQWMHDGAERAVLQAVSDGRLSLGKAVELLGITYWDVYDLVHKHGIEIGATPEESSEALRKAGYLLKRSRRRDRDEEVEQNDAT